MPIVLGPKELAVDFEGREVIYGFGEFDELVLAYATTIHKSQGSEYPAVVPSGGGQATRVLRAPGPGRARQSGNTP